jgi:hypothetical protein
MNRTALIAAATLLDVAVGSYASTADLPPLQEFRTPWGSPVQSKPESRARPIGKRGMQLPSVGAALLCDGRSTGGIGATGADAR